MARRVLFATHGDMLGPFALLSLRAMPRRPSVRQVAAQMMNSPQATLVRNRPALVNAIPNPTVPGAFIESPGWISAMRGGGLDGLGYLGDISVGGINFTKHDAHNDFINGVQLRGTAGRWDGVSQYILNNLEAAISNAVGPRGQRAVEDFKMRGQSIANRISIELQPFGFGGRSEAQDTQYKAAMQLLKTLMMTATESINAANQQDAAQAAKAPPPEEMPVQNQGAATVNTGSRPPLMQTPSFNKGPQFFQQAGGGPVFDSAPFNQGAMAQNEKKFPWVPVLVGGGIFVAGTAFLLMRRR